jgi:hypothetical protein
MTRLRTAALAALFILPSSLALADAACPTGQSFTAGRITVTGAFARATPKGAQSAGGYLTVANAGSTPDTFTGATSPAAGDIAIHQMKMNGNIMEMSPVAGGLTIPAGGSVKLDPMGYHLMMTGLSQPFVEGQCVRLTLHFAKAGDLPVQFNVGGLAQQVPPGGSSGASAMPSGGMDMSSMSMGM